MSSTSVHQFFSNSARTLRRGRGGDMGGRETGGGMAGMNEREGKTTKKMECDMQSP